MTRCTLRLCAILALFAGLQVSAQPDVRVVEGRTAEVSGATSAAGKVLLAALQYRSVDGLPRGTINVYGRDGSEGEWKKIHSTSSWAGADSLEFGDPQVIYGEYTGSFHLVGMAISRYREAGDEKYRTPRLESDIFLQTYRPAEGWSVPLRIPASEEKSFADYPIARMLDPHRLLLAYTSIDEQPDGRRSSTVELVTVDTRDGAITRVPFPDSLLRSPAKSVTSLEIAADGEAYLTIADPELIHIVQYDPGSSAFRSVTTFPHSFDWDKNSVITQSVLHENTLTIAAYQAHTVNSSVVLYRYDIGSATGNKLKYKLSGSHPCLLATPAGPVITVNHRKGRRHRLLVYIYGTAAGKLRKSKTHHLGDWNQTGTIGEYQYLTHEGGRAVQYYIDHSDRPGVGRIPFPPTRHLRLRGN